MILDVEMVATLVAFLLLLLDWIHPHTVHTMMSIFSIYYPKAIGT
jgi:hypothetical protein